ncbi:Hpt domain-containing protein [Microvirga massiliensis]|uniref:Hpt domain-containing protein n=1 Tax=Microvirga massiliensis TaxID=1033741 RepID=UPI00062B30C1|nr:Hpt domain-containing protein [Microvirga massiliensis]
MGDSDYDARMAQLHIRFVAMAATERDRLDRAIAALDTSERDVVLAEIRSIAHGISGTAGTFGFPEAGEAAEALENLVIAGRADLSSIREGGKRLSAELGRIDR